MLGEIGYDIACHVKIMLGEGLVREIAVMNVQPDMDADFEEAYSSVASVLEEAEGSHGVTLHRGVEEPDSYTLIVVWDSVEAHIALTETSEFERFSSAISPYLTGQPEVRHVEPIR